MKSGKKKPKRITVTVRGPALMAEFIKREVAVALSNIGAFDITAIGDFRNDDGTSCDPDRMRKLADLADEQLEIVVERR
jgi:hypothetical protein